MQKTIMLFLLLFIQAPVMLHASPAPPALSAKSAIIIEAATGEVLYEKNSRERRYPASTTKIMTIITALEAGTLDDVVVVSPNAASTEGSSMDLVASERMKLRDMLYGVALVSGNDAAVAVAEHISGSVGNFARLMTEKAHKIGAVGTNFTNSSGLPDPRHYSTAYDLALIAAYGYKNPLFSEYVGTLRKDIIRDRSGSETFYNENKLLRIYRGANGVKTGYTDESGRCLVSAASRGRTQLIAVVLDADFMWEDSMALLDYGFSQLQEKAMVQAGDFVEMIRVPNGTIDVTRAVISDSLFIPVTFKNKDEFRTVFEVAPEISAPVTAGQKVGVAKIMYRGKEIASTDVVLLESINRKSFFLRVKDFFASIFIGVANLVA